MYAAYTDLYDRVSDSLVMLHYKFSTGLLGVGGPLPVGVPVNLLAGFGSVDGVAAEVMLAGYLIGEVHTLVM